ncbi:MAG TPA: hypothetical protein PLK12_05510 [Prolixibacteraceae bacterium]|nr:hypothetical protein [Prolixibacteraceae bacterium]
MSQYQNIYAQKIYDIMAAYIGDIMSKGALRAQCKILGISEESIEAHNIPLLAEKLRKGLIIFVGSEGANQIATQIIQMY